ncbi:hypothetical protein BDZ91DRAFT_439480 [Kalaharituber pfeilii]|nr:hypothetical protein BDZ91DRAFT_439480 [Kalaharituber pfeilii]
MTSSHFYNPSALEYPVERKEILWAIDFMYRLLMVLHTGYAGPAGYTNSTHQSRLQMHRYYCCLIQVAWATRVTPHLQFPEHCRPQKCITTVHDTSCFDLPSLVIMGLRSVRSAQINVKVICIPNPNNPLPPRTNSPSPWQPFSPTATLLPCVLISRLLKYLLLRFEPHTL